MSIKLFPSYSKLEGLDTLIVLSYINNDFLFSILFKSGKSSNFFVSLFILLVLVLVNVLILISNSFANLFEEVSIIFSFPFSNKFCAFELSLSTCSIINSPGSFSSSKFSIAFHIKLLFSISQEYTKDFF